MYNNNNCCYNPCQCNNGRYGNYGYGYGNWGFNNNLYWLPLLFGIWIFHMPFIFMTNKLNTSYIIIEFKY